MVVWRMKAPNKIVEMGHRMRTCGATRYQKVEIFAILGAAFPPPCTEWREISHYQADPRDARRCQISQDVNADFRPVSKFNTGSLPLGGNPACNKSMWSTWVILEIDRIWKYGGIFWISINRKSVKWQTVFLSHSVSLAQNTLLMMSHSLIHLPPVHHVIHPPSHIHCFIPGSKLPLSTNLFHHSLLAPTWTAFSDYTGPDLLCSTVFHF